MGYRTCFELHIDAKNEAEIMADLRATNEEANYALDENGDTAEECKWYDHEKHLKEFSKKYPKAFFTMWGIGEDAGGDYWKHYVKNGKGQLVSGKIVYPPYKPLLMIE
jgi:hypothetical protein